MGKEEGSQVTRFRMSRSGRSDWEFVEVVDGRSVARRVTGRDTPDGLRCTCATCGASELFATVRARFIEWLGEHETCVAPDKAQKRASK